MKSLSEINHHTNLKWYPTYMAFSGAYFWLAIFFLYFESKLSLSDVLRIEAIYYFSVFILEVPTGYFSDKFGKLKSLRFSALFFLLSYVVFFFAQSFWGFAIAQILLASGMAFQSGSDTAFHYAALVNAGEEETYAKRESRIGAILNFTGGLAAFTGGVLGIFALHWAYGFSVLSALGALFIVFFVFKEQEDSSEIKIRFRTQILEILRSIRKPVLWFLFLSSISMTILVHIPYEYYQIYINNYIQTTDFSKHAYVNSTWVNGLHAAFAMTMASVFAAYSSRIKDRFGVRLSILLALVLITFIILVMASFQIWWVILILIFRSAPYAFLAPILNSEIVPRLDERLRATYLSAQSMAGRFAFGLVLMGLSYLGTENISTMLGYSVILGVSLILLVGIFSLRAKFESS